MIGSVPPQTVSKYNSQYHKLFQTVPKEEILMKGTNCQRRGQEDELGEEPGEEPGEESGTGQMFQHICTV